MYLFVNHKNCFHIEVLKVQQQIQPLSVSEGVKIGSVPIPREPPMLATFKRIVYVKGLLHTCLLTSVFTWL